MADFSIEADVSEVKAIVEALLDKRKTRPLMSNLGRIMQADTKLNFRRQASPEGSPWKPIKRKGQILSDTARLRNSITHRVISDEKVVVGTNVDYGRIHQYGFKGPQAVNAHTRLITQAFGKKLKYPVYQSVGPHTRFMNMPARPFLGFGPRALKKIDKAIQAFGDDLVDGD